MINTFPEKIEDLTLLITHFNRSQSLKRLLDSLQKHNICVEEIIVSDGGSDNDHLSIVKTLQEEFGFTLLTSEVNKGLGNTINMGQDAVQTKFILYIQEDFVPKAIFGSVLRKGLDIMKHEDTWDLVRFYSFPWSPFPYLQPYRDGFYKMVFSLSPWYLSHLKFHVYSDHPHLKRRTFPDKFGRYLETQNGDVTEMNMCRTFLKKKGKSLYYRDFNDLFEHDNPEEEPGLFRPDKVKTKKYAEIAPLYWIYLKYKLIKDTFSFVFNTKIK